jgi:hypothetical protein
MPYMRGQLQRLTTMAMTVSVALASLVVSAQPAQAVDIPAYGTITITNNGTGAVPTWTYDSALWTCTTEFEGQFTAPTAVTVRCVPNGDDSGQPFICPLMVLTTHTGGLAARAGGRVHCRDSGLDTGIISGVNSAQRSGNLGRADWIECAAYGGGVPLIPPYTVTCNEPGLPGL